MRKLRFQELRQLAHSCPAHRAHAIVGATDNEDILRQIFVKVHGVFFKWSPPSFLPYCTDQSSPKDPPKYRGLWPHHQMGGEPMSHCQKSIMGRRYFGSHVWKMQSAWGYLGKKSTDGRAWPTAWLGPSCSAQTIEIHAATSGPSVLFWETLAWVNHRGRECFLNLHTEPPGIIFTLRCQGLISKTGVARCTGRNTQWCAGLQSIKQWGKLQVRGSYGEVGADNGQ